MQPPGPARLSPCTFDDNGSYGVEGAVIDKDNASSTSGGSVTVLNVAPTADLANNGPINEGSSATVSFSNESDPTRADTTAGFKYSFACTGGAAALATTYAASGSSTSTSCPFDDNGSFTVYGRIFDKDDGYSTYSTTVVVNNVAPTATLVNTGPVNEGSPVGVRLTNPFDPSSADTGAGFHYAFSCTDGDLSGATYAGSSALPGTSCTFDDGPEQPHRPGADHRQGRRLQRVHDRRHGHQRRPDAAHHRRAGVAARRARRSRSARASPTPRVRRHDRRLHLRLERHEERLRVRLGRHLRHRSASRPTTTAPTSSPSPRPTRTAGPARPRPRSA